MRCGRWTRTLALLPVLEPSPNLLAQSRMRLDEALDDDSGAWVVDAAAGELLCVDGACCRALRRWRRCWLGLGFLAWELCAPVPGGACAEAVPGPVIISEPTKGVIANVSGIVQTPNSELVQVKYNRAGSGDGARARWTIRRFAQLLMMGMKAGDERVVCGRIRWRCWRTSAGWDMRACGEDDGKDVREALMVRAAV